MAKVIELEPRQMMLPELAKEFIFSGNATFTLRSKETGKRFTYKITKSDDGLKYWCKLLMGPNNESDYLYFGFFLKAGEGYKYVHGRAGKSCAARSAESVKAFSYTLGNIIDKNRIPDQVEFWHEGRCGRCGRGLTDPVSIERGFGPECIQHVGG